MNRHTLLQRIATPLAVVLLASCGMSAHEYDALIAAFPKHQDTKIYYEFGNPVEDQVVNSDGARVARTKQPVKAGKGVPEFVLLQPNIDAVWPGAIVQTRDISSGLLHPIGLPGQPRQITIDVPGLQGPLATHLKRIPNVAQGTVLDSIDSVLRTLPAKVPARMAYQDARVYSDKHALFAADMDVKWPTGSFSAGVQAANASQRTNMVFNLSQVYYAVTVSPPSSPSSFLKPGIRERSARRYMDSKNPPAYVASVSYGRRILMHASSTMDSATLNARFRAAYHGVTTTGSVGASAEMVDFFKQTSIEAVVLGGSPDGAAQLLAVPTPEAFAKLIKDGADYSPTSPGVPVSYTLRYLRDNDLLRAQLETDWMVERIGDRAYRKPFTARVDRLIFIDTADDDEDVSWEIELQALGQDNQILSSKKLFNNGSKTYVWEYARDRRDHCKRNCFHGGEEISVKNQPVFFLRCILKIKTEDGDGARWEPVDVTVAATEPGATCLSEAPAHVQGRDRQRYGRAELRLTFDSR